MGKLHIYSAPKQKATRFNFGMTRKEFIVKHPANRLLMTVCCRKERPAKNLFAQVYYDQIYYSCRPGKGCKR